MASQVKRDVAHAKSDFPKCPAEDSQGDIDKLEVGESSIMYHVAVVVTVFLAAALSYKPVIVSSLLLGTGFLFASYILYLIVANRQAAFPTARAFLEERVQEGLAVRRNRSRQRNPTRSSKHSCFSQALWWSIYSLCCSGDSTGGTTWHTHNKLLSFLVFDNRDIILLRSFFLACKWIAVGRNSSAWQLAWVPQI